MKTIYIVILAALAAAAVCILLGATGLWPNILSDAVMGLFSGVNVESFTSNPLAVGTTVLATAGSAVAVATPLYNKMKSYKEQATKISTVATEKINGLTSEVTETKDKLTSTEASLEGANKTISELNAAKTTLETQKASLEAQVKQATTEVNILRKATAADVINSLPGGSAITQTDGSVLAKVETIKVK